MVAPPAGCDPFQRNVRLNSRDMLCDLQAAQAAVSPRSSYEYPALQHKRLALKHKRFILRHKRPPSPVKKRSPSDS